MGHQRVFGRHGLHNLETSIHSGGTRGYIRVSFSQKSVQELLNGFKGRKIVPFRIQIKVALPKAIFV